MAPVRVSTGCRQQSTVWQAQIPLDGVSRFINERQLQTAEGDGGSAGGLTTAERLLMVAWRGGPPSQGLVMPYGVAVRHIQRRIRSLYSEGGRRSEALASTTEASSTTLLDAGGPISCLAWLAAAPGSGNQRLALCVERPRPHLQVWRFQAGCRSTVGRPFRYWHGFARVNRMKALPGDGYCLALACEDGGLRLVTLGVSTGPVVLLLLRSQASDGVSATALDTSVCQRDLLAVGFSDGACALWRLRGGLSAVDERPPAPVGIWSTGVGDASITDIRLHPVLPAAFLLVTTADRRLLVYHLPGCWEDSSGFHPSTVASLTPDSEVVDLAWILRHDSGTGLAVVAACGPAGGTRMDCSLLHGSLVCAREDRVYLVTVQEAGAETAVPAATEATESADDVIKEISSCVAHQRLLLTNNGDEVCCVSWNNNLDADHLLALGCRSGLVRLEGVQVLRPADPAAAHEATDLLGVASENQEPSLAGATIASATANSPAWRSYKRASLEVPVEPILESKQSVVQRQANSTNIPSNRRRTLSSSGGLESAATPKSPQPKRRRTLNVLASGEREVPATESSSDISAKCQQQVRIRWVAPVVWVADSLVSMAWFANPPRVGHIQGVRWPRRKSRALWPALVIEVPGAGRYRGALGEAVNDFVGESAPGFVKRCVDFELFGEI